LTTKNSSARVLLSEDDWLSPEKPHRATDKNEQTSEELELEEDENPETRARKFVEAFGRKKDSPDGEEEW
jgi:hypothetical protein